MQLGKIYLIVPGLSCIAFTSVLLSVSFLSIPCPIFCSSSLGKDKKFGKK